MLRVHAWSEKGFSVFHYLQCSPVKLHTSAVEVDFPSLGGRNLRANETVRTHSDIVAHHALIHGRVALLPLRVRGGDESAFGNR